MDAKRMWLTISPAPAGQGFCVNLCPIGMAGTIRLEGEEALGFLQRMQKVDVSQLDAWLFERWDRKSRPLIPTETPAENLTLGERMTALEKRLDVLIEQTRKPTDADLWDTFQRMRQQEAFRSGV